MRTAVNIYTGIFLFAFVACAYVITSAPLITAGDSGELAAAAFTLGISHPPGYPLYAIFGKAFSLIPIGSVAYRLNLMSSAFMALCAVLIYRTACVLLQEKDSITAAAVAAAWALTGTAWSQATYAEVYPQQLMLSLSSVYACVLAVKRSDARLVMLSCFLAGFSVVAHYGALLFMPAILFYLLYSGMLGRGAARPLQALLFFLIGLTPFLYLIIRAHAVTVVNSGDPDTISRFAAHLARSSYGDISAMTRFLTAGPALLAAGAACLLVVYFSARRYGIAYGRTLALMVAAISLSLTVYMVARGATYTGAAYNVKKFWSDGVIIVVPFALAALLHFFRTDRPVFTFLALMLFVLGGITLYRIPGNGAVNFKALSDKFSLQVWTAIYIVAAAGASWAAARLKPGGPVSGRAGYAILLLPVAFALHNFQAMDKSGLYAPQDYSTFIMRSLEQGSIFVAQGDNHVFLTAYARYVEDARPDVDVFAAAGSPFPPEKDAYRAMSDKRRPLYTSEYKDSGAVRLEQAGVLFRFPSPFCGPVPDPWKYTDIRADESPPGRLDYETRELLAEYRFSLARTMLAKGDLAGMDENLRRAAATGRDVMWVLTASGDMYMDSGMPEKARELFERTLDYAPGNPQAHYGLARYYASVGSLGQSRRQSEKAIAADRNFGKAWLLLARLREAEGDYQGAAKAFRGYMLAGVPDQEKASVERNIERLAVLDGKGRKTE